MMLAGGYPSQNNGIYSIHDHQVTKLIDEVNTTYFDVLNQRLVTVIKKESQSGIALYDQQHKIAEYLDESKPACFIKYIYDFIVVCYYHEGRALVFNHDLKLLHVFDYGKESKCHCAFAYNQQKQFGIVALGLDKIFIYDQSFDLIQTISFPSKTGVRHAILSENDQFLYAVSEYSNDLFEVDMKTQTMKQHSILDKPQASTGAAIKMSDDHQHLYTSTRGADLITHFRFQKHQLEAVQHYQCSGKNPRDFELLEDSIVIAYQDEDYMDVVELDSEGNLGFVLEKIKLSKIVCLKEIKNPLRD